MTQKELLYTMDAVNHLKHFTESLDKYKNEVSDTCKQVVCCLLKDATHAYQELTSTICTGGKC